MPAIDCTLSIGRTDHRTNIDVMVTRDSAGEVSLAIALTVGLAESDPNQYITFTAEEARLLCAHLASPAIAAVLA